MKASMTLKPLVFAIAAAMAIAAQASEQSNRHRNHDPLLDRSAGDATATVERDQYVGDDNTVTNQGTENTTDVSDSLNGNNGNVGANFASGTMNQQANDVVIATADEDFVFGTATASVAIGQENNGSVAKVSNVNSVIANGFGNDASGNVGINMASGDLNQQANALAIATARGWEVTANGGGYQDMTGNTVDNKASGAVYQNKFEFTKDFENNYEQHKSSDANFSASRSEEEQSASSKTAAASYTAHFDSSKTANKTDRKSVV